VHACIGAEAQKWCDAGNERKKRPDANARGAILAWPRLWRCDVRQLLVRSGLGRRGGAAGRHYTESEQWREWLVEILI